MKKTYINDATTPAIDYVTIDMLNELKENVENLKKEVEQLKTKTKKNNDYEYGGRDY